MDYIDLKLVVSSFVFSLIGVIFFVIAFWLMSKVTPFSLVKEIEEDQNVALAIVMASVILGLAFIVGSAVH
jgi:uncharacterized membrane protein YjfL (UPF0719 family)